MLYPIYAAFLGGHTKLVKYLMKRNEMSKLKHSYDGTRDPYVRKKLSLSLSLSFSSFVNALCTVQGAYPLNWLHRAVWLGNEELLDLALEGEHPPDAEDIVSETMEIQIQIQVQIQIQIQNKAF